MISWGLLPRPLNPAADRLALISLLELKATAGATFKRAAYECFKVDAHGALAYRGMTVAALYALRPEITSGFAGRRWRHDRCRRPRGRRWRLVSAAGEASALPRSALPVGRSGRACLTIRAAGNSSRPLGYSPASGSRAPLSPAPAAAHLRC